jgi:hypothetical protein
MGTLRVQLDVLMDHPSDQKVKICETLNQLTEKSPLLDLITWNKLKYPNLNCVLETIALFTTDYMLLYMQVTNLHEITAWNFEANLVDEMLELIKESEIDTKEWCTILLVKHQDFVNKHKAKLKLNFKERQMLEIDQTSKLITKYANARLNEVGIQKVKENYNQFENTDITKIQDHLKNMILNDELKLWEKPILFSKGTTVYYRLSDLLPLIVKLKYLDENSIQWLVNIETSNEKLNAWLFKFKKRLNYRYRWKDDERWMEWLKSYYLSHDHDEIPKMSASHSEVQQDTHEKIDKISKTLEFTEQQIKQAELMRLEKDNWNKTLMEQLELEIKDKDIFVHTMNIKWMLKEYERNWKDGKFN